LLSGESDHLATAPIGVHRDDRNVAEAIARREPA
jgi:hypothetical protein